MLSDVDSNAIMCACKAFFELKDMLDIQPNKIKT